MSGIERVPAQVFLREQVGVDVDVFARDWIGSPSVTDAQAALDAWATRHTAVLSPVRSCDARELLPLVTQALADAAFEAGDRLDFGLANDRLNLAGRCDLFARDLGSKSGGEFGSVSLAALTAPAPAAAPAPAQASAPAPLSSRIGSFGFGGLS